MMSSTRRSRILPTRRSSTEVVAKPKKRSMGETNATSNQEALVAGSTDYVRFIVLGDARTGSSMLVQALHSSPHIRCFREIFNWKQHFVDFHMEGYDKSNERDWSQRKRDPGGFLRERIFCQHPEAIRAVGFKFLYVHTMGFQGLHELLAGDRQLRVLHLRRRNLLRKLVSLKIAQATGSWLQEERLEFTQNSAPSAALSNALRAFRLPLKVARALKRLSLRRRSSRARKPFADSPRVRLKISAEELTTFSVRTETRAAHFDELFRDHPKLTLFYEDILDHREDVFNQAQSFLGIEPGPLTVTLSKQNPQPLRELLENYDELYEAVRNRPYADYYTAFFD